MLHHLHLPDRVKTLVYIMIEGNKFSEPTSLFTEIHPHLFLFYIYVRMSYPCPMDFLTHPIPIAVNLWLEL